MSFARNAGQFVGRVAADAFEGSKLVSTQFSQGVQEGYAERAARLRALRAEALAEAGVTVKVTAPKQPKQNKTLVKVQA